MCLHYPQKDSPIVLWIKNLKCKQKMGEERLIEGPLRINLCILLIFSPNLGIKSVTEYLILRKHWVWFCEHKLLLTIILANRISEAQGSWRGLHRILYKQSNSTAFPPETQKSSCVNMLTDWVYGCVHECEFQGSFQASHPLMPSNFNLPFRSI